MAAEPSSTVCHKEACAIQNCLQRWRYDESKCTDAIDALYACCSNMYVQDPTARAVACPRPDLLSLKIEQRSQQKVDAELRTTKPHHGSR
ncbi:hypothetical protein V1514DRAFT_339329 [Lipomyces japonicus]|uniref:uncharacterized protein n=1 Tax=Lipomyces japonicus TaxID=56871 RepID=UPI0034CF8B19